MRNISEKKVVEKTTTHISRSITFPEKNHDLMRQCGKTWYSQTGHNRWQYHAAHARGMLDTCSDRQSLRIYNTHCFSKATVVMHMRLNVTSQVHCLSCLSYAYFLNSYPVSIPIFSIPTQFSIPISSIPTQLSIPISSIST